MNSRERVMAAIHHEKVDRIPMFMDCTTSDVTEAVIKAAGCRTEGGATAWMTSVR